MLKTAVQAQGTTVSHNAVREIPMGQVSKYAADRVWEGGVYIYSKWYIHI